DAIKVADGFQFAADALDEGESEGEKIKSREIKKALLFRAARIQESALKDVERAEATYAAIVALDPEDEIAFAALEELRRANGKDEEPLEMLLEKSEKSESHSERARALNTIGHLYLGEMDDREQAAFAFAKALGQEATNDAYAVDLERAAGTDMKVWSE